MNTINEVRGTYDYVFTTVALAPPTTTSPRSASPRPLVFPSSNTQTLRSAFGDGPRQTTSWHPVCSWPRVPEGAELIDNPSGGPQGFAMENVHVMAGIPRVMQAMLSTLEGKLTTGPVIRSHTVRAYTGERLHSRCLSADPTRPSGCGHRQLSLLREDRYGTHLVIRSSDVDLLRRIADAVMEAVRDIGETPEDLVWDATPAPKPTRPDPNASHKTAPPCSQRPSPTGSVWAML